LPNFGKFSNKSSGKKGINIDLYLIVRGGNEASPGRVRAGDGRLVRIGKVRKGARIMLLI